MSKQKLYELAEVENLQGEAQRRASEVGLTIEVKTIRNFEEVTAYHWMYFDGPTKVLDYWPTNGSVLLPRNGSKARVDHMHEALAMAVGQRRTPLPTTTATVGATPRDDRVERLKALLYRASRLLIGQDQLVKEIQEALR